MHDDQKNVLSSTTLFVGDLSVTCTEPMLMQLFSQCGTTTEVRIIRTRRNASLGYAFVTMSTAEDATTAIKQLNGHMLNGRSLRIGFANEVDNRKQSAPQTAGLYNNGDLGSKDVNDVESLRSGFCSSQNHSSHGDYVPNIVHGPQNSSMPVVQPIHPLMTSENSSLLNAQLNSQQTSHDHANSVYFKFYMSQSRSTQEPATDEGIIRDLFCTKCGPNSVSDVSIRRIAEEDVSYLTAAQLLRVWVFLRQMQFVSVFAYIFFCLFSLLLPL